MTPTNARSHVFTDYWLIVYGTFWALYDLSVVYMLWLSSSDLRELATDIHGRSEIRDQVYDEKSDTVTIKVVCCSPEKIKEKIICKGGGCITSIQIVVPPKPETKDSCPKKDPPPKEDPPKIDQSEKKPKKLVPPPPAPYPFPINMQLVGVCCQQCYIGYPGGPCFHGYGVPGMTKKPVNPKPAPPPPAPVQLPPPEGFCCQECHDGYAGGPCFHGCGEPEEPGRSPPAQAPVPVQRYPPPLGACCQQCYDGYPGGPCFQGHGRPPPCYQSDGYGGRPVHGSYGGGSNHHVSRCDYLSEENPSACTIM
ncbi:hypothetical protein FNV43_RR07971 [Rhamnella rubrinervis]|uniref:Uncharacterized protein n=1 Tax=Rhamnella rubrinervis TaxID=2594499 RepID=A0A8K0HHK2_9ROSA|nr:hypothetical protein FNV43_RR07971 [Rhamnella rubrinervis]